MLFLNQGEMQTNFVLGVRSTAEKYDIGAAFLSRKLAAAGQRAFYYRGVKIWNNLNWYLKLEWSDLKFLKKCLVHELMDSFQLYVRSCT